MPPSKKNEPRFLDYRRSPLPLDVALSFAIISPTSDGANSNSIDNSESPRELILSGKVHVNNIVEKSCNRLVCRQNDSISIIDDAANDATKIVREIAMPRYFICYKPRGVICSTRRNEGIDRIDSVLISEWLANIMCLMGNKKVFDYTIKSVGRLDEQSEGLLLLTNDGSFSRLLCDPEFGLKKTYRVVARCSCYRKVIMDNGASSSEEGDDKHQSLQHCQKRKILMENITEMINSGNQPPSTECEIKTNNDFKSREEQKNKKPHFPYDSCTVLDAGRLSSQHASDDSYYALVDIVLREGKRHAVRRIISNAGRIRVCYLSRIDVEGLEDIHDVTKPNSIIEAHDMGFLPIDGQRHCKTVHTGKLLYYSSQEYIGKKVDDMKNPILLQPGNVIELRESDVDRIFALRNSKDAT